MNRQGRRPPIPIVMAATVDYLETHALKRERIFHIEPSEESIKRAERFIEQYNSGVDVRLSRYARSRVVSLMRKPPAHRCVAQLR